MKNIEIDVQKRLKVFRAKQRVRKNDPNIGKAFVFVWKCLVLVLKKPSIEKGPFQLTCSVALCQKIKNLTAAKFIISPLVVQVGASLHFTSSHLLLISLNMSSDDSNRKFYVGNLSANTTDEAFKDYFGRFGEVTDCIVMRDQQKQSR